MSGKTSADQAGFEGLGAAEVLESAPDALVIVDAGGIIKLVNARTAALFGYPRGELLGQPVDLLVPPGQQGLHLAGPSTSTELFGRRRDGSRFAAEVSLSPLPTAQGRPVIIAIRDVSERKKIEEVRAHARWLEEENRRIQQASRKKSEFVANLSHEFRTPLNAIVLLAELLRDQVVTPESPTYRGCVHDLLASARHLQGLIDNVLDLAKLEAGKTETRRQPVDAHGLAREVTEVLRALASEKNISLDLDTEGESAPLHTDAGKLRQILYNLLSNAIKFTPAGGRVRTRVARLAPSSLVIEVEDTGIGLPPEAMARLFVPFQQLGGGLDAPYPGTGLGLALTRSLVESLAGTIEVQSEVGKGARFTVTLPVEGDAAGVGLAADGDRVPASLPLPAASRVLIVDDNVVNLRALSLLLTHLGCEVRKATGGAQMWTILDHFHPDLVLMDIQLPETDGLELTRQLKSRPATSGLMVVALTARALEGDTARILAAGCDGYIAKPVDSHTLGELIAGYLVRARLPREPADDRRNGLVLLIEDDADLRTATRLTLESHGYSVQEAEDGKHALDLLTQVLPDLVILDLMLPDVSGVDLKERIRALRGATNVPIIAMTGFPSQVEDGAGEAEGTRFSAFLLKPVHTANLVSAVERCLTAPAAAG
jgi:PAS domain S-box-containing protein